MLIGASVFAYIVASIFFVCKSSSLQILANTRVIEVTEFLRSKQCPQKELSEITTFLRKKFSNKSLYDEKLILSRLPVRLRIRLILAQNRDVLTNIPIFEYIQNPSRKVHVLNLLKPVIADMGEPVITEGVYEYICTYIFLHVFTCINICQYKYSHIYVNMNILIY
jgi:hypothetical protein